MKKIKSPSQNRILVSLSKRFFSKFPTSVGILRLLSMGVPPRGGGTTFVFRQINAAGLKVNKDHGKYMYTGKYISHNLDHQEEEKVNRLAFFDCDKEAILKRNNR